MRRKDRQIPREEAILLLKRAEYGVLSTVNPDGTPYAVPMNFIYHENDNKIYFHAAKTGQKLDNMKLDPNPKVVFTVVGETKPVVESNSYSTIFESTIVFGSAYILKDPKEVKEALYILTKKYFPNDMHAFDAATTEADLARLYVIAMDVEHISGKAKRG